MKFWKTLLMVTILLANFLFVQPSWADRKPKDSFAQNPDYIQVTKALDNLYLAKEGNTPLENYTPEEIQEKIDRLEFQKYNLETGITWGQCRNETGKTVAVYGPKPKKSSEQYDNLLYYLGDGQTTKKKWDCDGFYVPNDVSIADSGVVGQNGPQLPRGIAVKVPDGTSAVLKTNPTTGALEFDPAFTEVLQAGDANWFIPNVSQASIDARIPNALGKDKND